MTESDQFYCPERSTTGIFKEKGSTFLSFLYPLTEEGEVKKLINNLEAYHVKSRHICYAYKWGPIPDYFKIQDDGEPSGTAGKPILGQLIKYKLENTLLVVVRYFGGTLLGTSGLINAYKSASENAIQNSTIVIKKRNCYFSMLFEYPMEKYIYQWVAKSEGVIISKDYNAEVQFQIAFPLSMKEKIPYNLKYAQLSMNWPKQVSITYLKEDLY